MNTQWRKVWGDARAHRVQITLIGLVLVSGTAAVVAALNARAILQREIAESYRASQSPDLMLSFDRVESSLLEEIRSQPGVADADAHRVAFTRMAGPAGAWFPTRLLVVRDFADQRVGVVHQHSGAAWPNQENGILLEQSSSPLLGVEKGDQVKIRLPGGAIKSLPVTGIVHDGAVAPSTQDRAIYAYVTPATAALLGQSPDFDQVWVKMNDRRSGPMQLAAALKDWLTARNQAPAQVLILPNTHPHAALMAAMLRILGVMAGLAFACSAALATYVISLWMKREVRQVGIMKTMGARSHQLAGQYLALVAPLVLLATGLGFPLGVLSGRGLVRFYETNLNIDLTSWEAPSALVGAEIIFSLFIPLLAMAIPILRAARLTARQAIQDPGITAQTAPRPLAARLLSFPGSRFATFALRNTLRRPWRLGLSVFALAAGGALLLTAANLYASMMRVIDISLEEQAQDIVVTLPRPMPPAQLESLARRIPGVEMAEAWRRTSVSVVGGKATADAFTHARRFLFNAYPGETRLRQLPVKEGRWPEPTESGAVVITRVVQTQIPGLGVGSEVTLQFRERVVSLRVVGLVEEIATPAIYTNFPTFELATGLGEATAELRIKTQLGRTDSVVTALDDAFLDARIGVSQILTRAERRKVLDEHFLVVIWVCNMIALAAFVMGAISLLAFASLNVLERAREIGVIRALGATHRKIVLLFVAESGAIALLSAVLALVIALFATTSLNGFVSRNLLQVAVPLTLSWSALGGLFSGAFVVVLGVAVPLANLVRKSARDVLAYE